MRSLALAMTTIVLGCGHHTGDGVDASGTPGNPIVVTCTGCPDFPPLGPGSPPPCSGIAVDPQLVYPPDHVLLPPNMNVIEAHFMPGANNTIFEIDFENAATDVRLETQ